MSDTEFMLLDRCESRRTRNQFLIRVLVFGFAFIVGFVVLSLVLSSNTPALKRPQFVHKCSLAYDYDFSLLTLRWPNSICQKSQSSCPQYVLDKWLIHGLWPTYANQSWPQYCCFERKFEPKNLDPIRADLLANWPNLESGKTEDSLWAHEWQKHGTCTKTEQIDYFNNTLNLFNKFPVYEWLQKGNISPNNDTSYDSNAFEKVFADRLGHKVQLKCSANQNSKTLQIEEILICVSHTKTPEPIDCPEPSTCGQSFIYPKAQQLNQN